MHMNAAFFTADSTGAPQTLEANQASENGGVLVGWSRIEQGTKPFEVALHHGLGTAVSTLEYWFWGNQNNKPTIFRWSGKKSHPDEAGPVRILCTEEFIYFTFEANKPLFVDYEIAQDKFQPIANGWIGALVIPA